MKNVRRQLLVFAVLLIVMYFSETYLLEYGFNDFIDGIAIMLFFGASMYAMGKGIMLLKQFSLIQQEQ